VIWEANEHAGDGVFEDFAVSMLNISTQLRANGDDVRSFGRNLVGVSRSVSVELRKLLLGDALFSKCVREPKLHKLVRPNRLNGDPFEDTFGVQGGTIQFTKLDEPGAGTSTEFGITPMNHTVVIHPLYGLCFQKASNVWTSTDPFAKDRTPIRLKWWLKQPVLQIDGARYEMRDMLFEVANTQGAHSDRRKDTIRQHISEHWHSIYLNIFTLRVGIYLSNQFAASVSANSSLHERIAKSYPGAMEDLYKVDATLRWESDQLRIDHGDVPLHFGGEEELSTTFAIKVPPS
jgi:hypothetical protein